ncbi:c-type cytochrome [Anaeromyxobacter oryzisoli]|uniref:c-type cytochrome n=1 Tax=Anaeromyxobacter oryzisoli TaxID=2925408 RepID=UPI001F59C2F1|nr:cytochrome c [Anaeromyxobacter sp. SG63]
MSRRPSAAAILALLALTGCPRLDPMQRQLKYKAYQENRLAPDGLAMLQPPAGTVPYGPPLDPVVATGLGPDGKPVAVMPFAPDARMLARGRVRFDTNCAACHGVLGDGESQVALNMSLRRPPSLHLYRELPDGYIFQIITMGFGLMPSYRHLTVDDRWAVVAYVRALQLSQHVTVGRVPPEVRRRLEQEGR